MSTFPPSVIRHSIKYSMTIPKLLNIKHYVLYVTVISLALSGVPHLAEAEKEIQASFFPYYDFTLHVANNTATVTQFLPLGAEPHDWEPSLRQVQTLSEADIIVYNGLGVDTYVDRLVESGDLDDTVFIKATEGLALLSTGLAGEIGAIIERYEHGHYTPVSAIQAIEDTLNGYDIRKILEEHRAGDLTTTEALTSITNMLRISVSHDDHGHDTDTHDDEHGHDHDDTHDDHAHGDDQDTINDIRSVLEEVHEGEITHIQGLKEIESLLDVSDDGHDHAHDHGIYDPHVWLDPVLALHQVKTIRDGLIAADPDNSAAYWSNAVSYIKDLEDLHNQYATTLSSCNRDTIVTFHAAFEYLVERYGLEAVSLSGVTGSETVSTTDIIELSDYIVENDIKYILSEDIVDTRSVEVIAEETGAQTLTLSPLEGITRAEFDAGVSYIDKMMENLEVLIVALECN